MFSFQLLCFSGFDFFLIYSLDFWASDFCSYYCLYLWSFITRPWLSLCFILLCLSIFLSNVFMFPHSHVSVMVVVYFLFYSQFIVSCVLHLISVHQLICYIAVSPPLPTPWCVSCSILHFLCCVDLFLHPHSCNCLLNFTRFGLWKCFGQAYDSSYEPPTVQSSLEVPFQAVPTPHWHLDSCYFNSSHDSGVCFIEDSHLGPCNNSQH